MKETLLQYARYNIWANKRIIDVMLRLQPMQLDQEIVSSFSTLRETAYHTWSAERVWLQRLQLIEHPIWMEADFSGDFAAACKDWEEASAQLKDFVTKQYNDAAFSHVMQYYTRQKESKKSKVSEVLIHVFNHSTYHRGQLVTMLRQVGVGSIPATDFIAFSR